jgi:hypothetical protein
MQSRPGETVADTSFGSVGCDHAMAGIVEQKNLSEDDLLSVC